ncbi:MAG: proton-conducting transporter transmembrane domain-containing protein [Ferrimicrobium sp.]
MAWVLLAVAFAVLVLAVLGSAAFRSVTVAERLNAAAAVVFFLAIVPLLWLVPGAGETALDHEILLDPFGVWVLVCLACVYLASSIYGIGYMRWMHEEVDRLHWYYALFAAFALAMFLAPIQNSPGLYWIAIDLTTIVSAFLVGFQRAPESIEAAWKYIVIVSAGLSLALLGTVLFYWAGTATFGPVYSMTWANFAIMAPKASPDLLLVAFLLVLVGFGTKVGLAPMHTWLPDAHSEGPAPVSAMLSGALLNCAMLGIVRYLNVLHHTTLFEDARTVLIGFGVASLVVAALFITRQSVAKRLAAYSSVEHMGIIAMGFGFGGVLGVVGALYLMLNHSLTKSLVFFGSGNMMHAYNSKEMSAMRRIGTWYPFSGGLWLLGAVAITGAPPFGLFLGELTVLRGGLVSHNPWGVWVMGALLVVIFIGFLSHFVSMYFGSEPLHVPTLKLPRLNVAPMAVIAVVIVVLGLWWPRPLWEFFLGIAHHLGGA